MKHLLFSTIFMVCTLSLLGQDEAIETFDLTGTLNFSYDYEFAEDADGNIWLLHSYVGAGVLTKLLVYENEAWREQEFPQCETCIRDIQVGPDQKIYIAASDMGVYSWNGSSWDAETALEAIRIKFDADGKLVIVNFDGVFTVDGTVVTAGNNANVPSFFVVNDLDFDHNGNLWMVISGKLFKYNDADGWVQKVETLSPYSVEVDSENKVWVNENHGGISYFENDVYKYNQITGVFPSGNRSTSFTIDKDDIIYLGVQGDDPGVIKYDNGSKKLYKSSNLIGSTDRITAIYITENKEIWTAAEYTNMIGRVYQQAVNDDMDGDGFTVDVDCDDNNADINPDAEEIANNDIDENCDGELLIIDMDGDGFNSDVDCDDNNASINPGAEEILNNDIDENCDGELGIVDMDGDGFNSDVDCDDNDAAVNPDAEEIANNDVDENCDGELLIIDMDGDGFNSDVDCDDNNAAVNPEAEEVANNDVDENCDGEVLIIDMDGDGFNSDVDCDDNNAAVNPEAEDIPNNGIDENCDGEDLVSSVDDLTFVKHISISPNPVSSIAVLNMEGLAKDATVHVLSLDGKLILELPIVQGTSQVEINMETVESGIYILRLISAKESGAIKVVKE